MPARIEGAVLRFVSQSLNIQVWAGESPRYDPYGLPINPDTITQPPAWPVVHVELPEGGRFSRKDTTEDPYDDEGELVVRCWAVTLEDCCAVQDRVEALLRLAESWLTISNSLGFPAAGDRSNPYSVVECSMSDWWRGQEKGIRDAKGRLVHRGDLTYQLKIHGALPCQKDAAVYNQNVANFLTKASKP